MTYAITAQPAAEPLTLDEVKMFLNLTSNDDDAMLEIFIKSAREWAEKVTGRALLSQTVVQYWDCFPAKVWPSDMVWTLDINPVTSVTSIQYKDTNGATQTLNATNYTADTVSQPARIFPTEDVSYPDLGEYPNAVFVTYVAGYATTAAVPAALKTAMLQKIAFLYENREDIPIQGVGAAYRVRSADALLFNNRLNLV